MSWTYWGIVMSIGALIVMLIACVRMLSSNDNEDREGSKHGAVGPGAMQPEPSTISRRAA